MRAALVLLAMTSVADARGIDFHLYGDKLVIAENARIMRCDDGIIKHAAMCTRIDSAQLVGDAVGDQLELTLLNANGGTVWRRTLTGVVRFADKTMIVLEAGTGYRAVWLDLVDGHTLADVAFAPVKGVKLPGWCGDQIQGVYRSNEAKPRLAAVCVVLD